MKKIALGTAITLLLLLALIFAALAFTLNSTVKRGVETIGSRLAQVDVKLNNVNLSLLSGSGKLQGLVVANPPNYKSPTAIQVANASLSVVPRSLLSDKVIVRSIHIEAPEITFETDLRDNNFKHILANLEGSTSGGNKTRSAPTESKAGKKLQVDDFLITGGRIHVSVTALGNHSAEVALPEIHLQDLGKGPDGITSADLAQKVLHAISERAAESVAAALANGNFDLGKGLSITNLGNAEKITKGLRNLLKPKK